MLFEHQGRQFHTVRGSDVKRDGMFLELAERGGPVLLEAFFSDQDQAFVLTGFGGSVPLEVVEQFLTEVRSALPPASQSPSPNPALERTPTAVTSSE